MNSSQPSLIVSVCFHTDTCYPTWLANATAQKKKKATKGKFESGH